MPQSAQLQRRAYDGEEDATLGGERGGAAVGSRLSDLVWRKWHGDPTFVSMAL